MHPPKQVSPPTPPPSANTSRPRAYVFLHPLPNDKAVSAATQGKGATEPVVGVWLDSIPGPFL